MGTSNSRIKNEAQYEAFIDKGYSTENVAIIANTPDAEVKGGKVCINGRSKMSKSDLIYA